MLTGELPWGHLSTPMQVIYVVGVLKKRLRIPDGCPEALRQLICECWQDDADLRPPFSDIVPRLEVSLPSV
ncbi:probable mitogen-activated protein kinase kinase kinase 20 [Coccomyxa sp. Obi]|nr:probable mitogen-activated protein kinase kinase kinase 20 [Coccomyxa sp. Obi]